MCSRRSSEILRGRYQVLLEGASPCKIATGLCKNSLLTDEELRMIFRFEDDAKQSHELMDILSRKGIPMLTKYTAAIKSMKNQQKLVHCESSGVGEAPSPTCSQRALALAAIPHRIEEECQGFPGTNTSPVGNLAAMNSPGVTAPHEKVQARDSAGTLAAMRGSSVSDSFLQYDYDLVAAGSVGLDHRADHSKELLSFKMDEQHFEVQMEAFTVLLFTFFSQLRVSIDRRPSSPQDGDASSKEEQSSSSQCQPSKNNLSWISLDVDYQSIREYFPAELLKGVNPSVEHLVPLRLSVLLDAFQQLYQKYMNLVQDNKSMENKLRCLPNAVELNSTSEGKSREGEGALGPYSRSSKGAESRHDVGDKLQRLQSLERAYANTEERCKQLVEVTQQWSAECADKEKLIAVQATQIEQLQAELEKIQRRLSKYKKHWTATKDAPPKRASDAQFEELRLELACRRELHDQVVAERDESRKRISELTVETDELKDLVEELRDRLSNFKVQAQAKEPSVRELSLVMEENRRLREELDQFRKTNAEQSDKLLAYETYVNDLTSRGDQRLRSQTHPPGLPTTTSSFSKAPLMPSSSSRSTASATANVAPTLPKPKLKKAPCSQQAMVTGGFGIPSHIKREVRSRHPQIAQHKHQQQPPRPAYGDDIIARGTPPLPAPPTHHQLAAEPKSYISNGGSDDDSSSVTTTSSVFSNEDTLSQHSSNGHGEHAHHPRSTPTEHNHAYQSKLHPQQFSPTTPVKTTASQSYLAPSASPSKVPLLGTIKYPPGLQIPPTLRNGALSPRGDYTQHVRYPNNSGIIVKPLTDDERTLRHTNGKNAAVRVHEDPVALLPADSTLYDFTLNEKQCPVCQHVFVTLSEKEFQSHVSLCFK